MMARSIDRRTFLKAAGTSTVALLGVPLLPSRSAAQSDKLVVAVGQWGLETPFAWRSSQSEKTLWDCVYDSLITRDPKTLCYASGAGHGMEAVERDANLDLQAAPGRAVPRGARRDDRRGREVHDRAEPQAGLAGRLRALLPHQPRPYRDPRQVHDRAALQESPVGGAGPGLAVRRLPEHHVEEVHGDGGRGEGGPAPDRHRILPPRRGSAGRLPPLRGGAQALAADAGVQGAGGAPDSRRRGAAVRSAHG